MSPSCSFCPASETIERSNGGTRTGRCSPVWAGTGYAGHLMLCGQVVLIYGDAVIAKLREPDWLNGAAMHYIFQNACFVAPSGLMALLETRFLGAWSILTITWATLAIEAFIAISAFGSPTVRRYAFAAGIGLHCGIAAALGLISFGMVMIGLLAVACNGIARSHSVTSAGDSQSSS